VSLTTPTEAMSLTLIVLTVLLALFLAAIIRTPPWVPQQEPEPAGPPSRPELAGDPPTAPLPRRIAGESGWVAPATGEPTYRPGAIVPSVTVPGTIQPPRVSGRPPWGPAPQPPSRY
jgi:hypothetical protein